MVDLRGIVMLNRDLTHAKVPQNSAVGKQQAKRYHVLYNYIVLEQYIAKYVLENYALPNNISKYREKMNDYKF